MADTETTKKGGMSWAFCYGGACDGEKFQHQEGMKKVKIRERGKVERWHVYVWHEGKSAERGVPTFVHESIEPWKVG